MNVQSLMNDIHNGVQQLISLMAGPPVRSQQEQHQQQDQYLHSQYSQYSQEQRYIQQQQQQEQQGFNPPLQPQQQQQQQYQRGDKSVHQGYYYEIRCTLRQLDRCMGSLEQELLVAKDNMAQGMTTTEQEENDNFTITGNTPAMSYILLEQQQQQQFYGNGETNNYSTNGGGGGGDDNTVVIDQVCSILCNDLMTLITLDTCTNAAMAAANPSSSSRGASISGDDDSTLEELVLAMIPIATRLLQEIITPTTVVASEGNVGGGGDAGSPSSSSSTTLQDVHLTRLLLRLVQMLQQDHSMDTVVLQSCLNLLNGHLTPGRLGHVLPQDSNPSIQCLFMIRLLLPDCLSAMMREQQQSHQHVQAREQSQSQSQSQSQQQQQQQHSYIAGNNMTQHQEQEDEQAAVWLQLRVLTGTFLEFLARELIWSDNDDGNSGGGDGGGGGAEDGRSSNSCSNSRNSRDRQRISLASWIQTNLVRLNPYQYSSLEGVRQEALQMTTLIRNYIVELVEYALQRLVEYQQVVSNNNNNGADSNQQYHVVLLQHAALASNALVLRDALGFNESQDHANRGLTRSLWKTVLSFVATVPLDPSLQLAATGTCWKLAQQVILLVFESSPSSSSSMSSGTTPIAGPPPSTGITARPTPTVAATATARAARSILMDTTDASLLSITILRLVEHADYFWTNDNQTWIQRVLEAAGTTAANHQADTSTTTATDGMISGGGGGGGDSPLSILRHALYAAALSVLCLPHPNLLSGDGANGANSHPTAISLSRDDKMRRLMQLALFAGNGGNSSATAKAPFDDPWFPFVQGQAMDYWTEMQQQQ